MIERTALKRRNPSKQPLLNESNSDHVSFNMTAATLTTGRIVGIVVTVVVLFVLGFVIGWVSAPSDEDSTSSETYNMKYIAKKRKEEMKTKDDFHKKLIEILNADKIGENLRSVI
jgi:mannitol-specific phosphotransferase system IIBC component